MPSPGPMHTMLYSSGLTFTRPHEHPGCRLGGSGPHLPPQRQLHFYPMGRAWQLPHQARAGTDPKDSGGTGGFCEICSRIHSDDISDTKCDSNVFVDACTQHQRRISGANMTMSTSHARQRAARHDSRRPSYL